MVTYLTSYEFLRWLYIFLAGSNTLFSMWAFFILWQLDANICVPFGYWSTLRIIPDTYVCGSLDQSWYSTCRYGNIYLLHDYIILYRSRSEHMMDSSSDEDTHLECPTEDRIWEFAVLPNGRRTISRPRRTHGVGFIHILYTSRAMEWVNFKVAIKEWLLLMNLEDRLEAFEQITFGWRHLPSITSSVYLPKAVFLWLFD